MIRVLSMVVVIFGLFVVDRCLLLVVRILMRVVMCVLSVAFVCFVLV